MEITKLEDLLTQIAVIDKFYAEETAKSGSNFNIFLILKLHSAEVRLHSALIAELLNPKGTHGQKDIFLRSFFDKFQFKENNFQTNDAIVELEKHFGFLDDDNLEGGRVDIIIYDKNRNPKIIIENKIYAADQKNQLIRYNKISPSADLFYLTLNGREPSGHSSGTLKLDFDFKCLSYELNIIQWLEDCKNKISKPSLLSETISQYINLLKYLTNQTINDRMENKIASLITSNIENVETTFTLLNNVAAIKNKMLQKLNLDLEHLAVKMNMQFLGGFDFGERFNGVRFSRENWEYGSVGFIFQKYTAGLIYGISAKTLATFPDSLRTKIIEIKPTYAKSTPWWPMYFDFESPFDNWDNNKEVWMAIFNGSILENIEFKLNEILKLLDKNNVQL